MDYTTPFVEWLIKNCDYVKNNKLFLNAVTAENNNKQIVTQHIARSEDKHYCDGSVLRKIKFTIFDFQSISFNMLVKNAIDNNENIEGLLSASQIIDFIEQAEKDRNYPLFADGIEVQEMYSEYGSPSTPSIDSNASLAKYSIPVTVVILDTRDSVI